MAMSISAETLTIWADISELIEANVRRTVRDFADAKDVVSEIRVMFFTGDHGAGYAPAQAINYCVRFLKKQALRQLGFVAVRRTVGRRGAYSAAIEGAEREEDLGKIEGALRPYVEHLSYEELVTNGKTPENWCNYVDPLNPQGYDERIQEYLQSPHVDGTAKRMALMMLEGYTQRQVAVAFSTSEQTVQRHLARESVKLEYRGVTLTS